jgi:hypothetical protein
MHRFHFFRAGGVDQVSLRDGKDLLAIPDLDQKLWVALAMPAKGVDVEPETIALIDLSQDGRIRVNDVIDAIHWIEKTFVEPGDVIESHDEVKLGAIKDKAVVAAAKRMLSDLSKKDATSISVEDANAITKAFEGTLLNGDGIVIPASTEDADVRHAIEDAIALVESVTDRSGKPGIAQAHADKLFAAVDERAAWLEKGKEAGLLPLGDKTAAAADAFAGVRDKLEDYFTRCKVAAYDTRGQAVMAGDEDALKAVAARALSPADEELARLPLSKIDPAAQLSLSTGLNPAWADRMRAFVDATVTPILGARDRFVQGDLVQVVEKLSTFETWRKAQPKTIVDLLAPEWLAKLADKGDSSIREKLRALIASDAALAAEYDQITSVAKVVRMQRDFGRILRNFVNFSDFYSKRDGVFQAGTLFLDARALHLCVPVADVAKHAALATSADSYLLYADITRKGETHQIAAALTNGDPDNIFIGRNGIFYDRDGNDWDATVTKIIANPISIRQAFWSPYKKLVKAIEDNVTRRAAAADADATAKLEATGKTVAHVDKAATVAAPPPPAKKIDLGTVAAIGVAIGGIGTLFGALFVTLFGLGAWLPLGVIAILLLISGPAMALAWLKLRRRNLGPILDANGWAINGRARINVAFGAAMTEVAKLPKGSQRSLDDPYADKKTPWKRWVLLAFIVILGGAWFVGKLDKWLPAPIRSTKVLGKYAPASKKEPAPTPAKPEAPDPAKAGVP